MQTHQPQETLETSRESGALLYIKSPLQNEEDFLVTHHSHVKDLEIADATNSLAVELTKHGTAFTDRYTMSSGMYYNVVTLLPDRLTTDIPLDIRTPWFTTEKGHNRRTAEAASALGIPVRLFAPPRIEIDKHPCRILSSAAKAFAVAQTVSMDADVASYAMISNAIDDLHKDTFARGYSMAYGESRGAMEGFGALSLSQHYGRKLLWLEAIDGCVPTELKTLDLIGNPKSIAELFAAVKTAKHLLNETRRLKYIDTIDASLDYLIPAITTKTTLFSGRAGEFAERIPTSSHGHGTFFDSSVANGYETFKQKLAHAPGFSLELLCGGHLTLAAREIIYRSLARISAARDAIERHGEDFAVHELEKIRAAKPHRAAKIKTSKLAA